MKLLTTRYLLVYGLLCFQILSYSQQIEVTASKPDLLSNTLKLQRIFGHDDNYFYVIRFSGTQYFIEKLDRNLNHIAEEPIKSFKGLKTFDFEAIFHFHNEIYVFFSRPTIDHTTLYYQRIDKNTLLPPDDEMFALTTIKNIKGSWADFHFALSRHETRLLVASRIKLPWSGAQFNEIYVFGSNLELEWKRKDSFEFKGQGPRDNRYVVDEVGNVSILSLIRRESLLSLRRDERNLYHIYRYTNNGTDYNEYPVTLNELYIRGIKIIAGTDGELICAGLFSTVLKAGVRGTFYFKIDAVTGKIFDRHLNEFDESVMAELASIDEPLIREEELMSYVVSDIVLREEGNMVLIAEQVFRQNYNTYNNLLITLFDRYGSVKWTRIIQKNQNFNNTNLNLKEIELADFRENIRQTGQWDMESDNYCSYALMAPLNKSGIILFMNDNIRNLNQNEKPKPLSTLKKSYVLAISIDEFGNLNRTPLIPWKRKMFFPQPIRYYDTLGDIIVIPTNKYRRMNYYKFTADAIP